MRPSKYSKYWVEVDVLEPGQSWTCPDRLPYWEAHKLRSTFYQRAKRLKWKSYGCSFTRQKPLTITRYQET